MVLLMNNKISTFLCVTALAFGMFTPISYGDNLRVAVGATGYLGEVSPHLRTVYFEQVLRDRDLFATFHL